MRQTLMWALKEGGVSEMEVRSDMKNRVLYNYLDENDEYYSCEVRRDFRFVERTFKSD